MRTHRLRVEASVGFRHRLGCYGALVASRLACLASLGNKFWLLLLAALQLQDHSAFTEGVQVVPLQGSSSLTLSALSSSRSSLYKAWKDGLLTRFYASECDRRRRCAALRWLVVRLSPSPTAFRSASSGLFPSPLSHQLSTLVPILSGTSPSGAPRSMETPLAPHVEPRGTCFGWLAVACCSLQELRRRWIAWQAVFVSSRFLSPPPSLVSSG